MPMVDFGEISLEYSDETRSSTVTALTDCDVWVLAPLSLIFDKVELGKVTDLNIMNQTATLEKLDKVELFKKLGKEKKLKLIENMKVAEFKAGEYIFHEGDRDDHFYIIEKGEIHCGFEQEANKLDTERALHPNNNLGLEHIADNMNYVN